MAFVAIAGLLALLAWFLHNHQIRLERESEGQLRELFDDAPVAYHELDRDGVVRRVNRAECALLGYQAGEMVGRPIWEFIAAGEQAESSKALGRKLSGEQPLTPVKRRYVRRDGAELLIEIHDRLVRNEAGEATGIRTALLDITARVAAEARVQRYVGDLEAARAALAVEKERAEAASRAKSEFLSSMSHEIRTPMNGVMGMTELLLDTPLTAEQKGYAETVRVSGEALLGIINDILDFSKIESGKLELEIVPFDLCHTLEDAVGLLAVKAHEKELELLLRYAQDAPCEFLGDPGRIRQVVLNLVSNAIKFTEHGHVLVEVGSKAIPGGGASIRIAVHDTGIGIPADCQGMLFQKFQQLDSSTTRKYGGTGLGLAISRQLVELMGGAMSLTSETGEGSTFSFEIPLRPSMLREADPLPAAKLDRVPCFARKRVLLVEDNIVNRKVGAALLGKLGCGVDVAADGREALDLAAQFPYDLIFMDCQMPEMDGYQASSAIRQTEGAARHTPIIALTASVLPEDRERCTRAGMDDYLSKPAGTAALAAALERWLAKSSPETAAPVFERATFLARIMGDEDLARVIMEAFLDDMPSQIEKLALAVNAGDIRKIDLQAHRIKGASANVGGEALRGAAGEMEEASKAGRLEALGTLLPGLKERFAQLKEAMEKDVREDV